MATDSPTLFDKTNSDQLGGARGIIASGASIPASSGATNIDFIFEESSSKINLSNADDKVSFDKFLDDLVDSIKDGKIKYFYRNEFKNLFFKKLKNQNKKNLFYPKNSNISLKDKQIYSFLTAYLVHDKSRNKNRRGINSLMIIFAFCLFVF